MWDGPEVTRAARTILARGVAGLTLGAPLEALSPTIALATFGPKLTTTPVEGTLAAVDDATGTIGDACEGPASLRGKVAFVEAGGCSDVAKVLSVQGAEAAFAILVDDRLTSSPLAPTGSDDGKVTIPSVRISQRDASKIRVQLGMSITASLRVDPDRGIGTSATGRVYLNATDPVKIGSSVSHWDPIATPDLLMEPALGKTPALDLTLPLMHDLGWQPYASRGEADAAREASDVDACEGAACGAPGGTDAAALPSEGTTGKGIAWAPKEKGCACSLGAARTRSAEWMALGAALAAAIGRRRQSIGRSRARRRRERVR